MRKLTVTALTRELERLFLDRYPSLLVEGEVGTLNVPASGHAYLTLRDRDPGGKECVLNCVMWRANWQRLGRRPARGDRVVCRGKLGLYGQQGKYQLYIDDMQPAGVGDLARQIAERIERLRADGLLEASRKRPLPPMPRFVGVATSLTGAALQDFLEVSRERFPAARILVAGCQVQGELAPASIVRALDLLLEDGRSEVLVVTRGGGSKEDLLAFQDEQLARYMASSPVPVVSAVGHQIDTTISDLVADAVAPTPSAAAMLVLPDAGALRQRVDELQVGLEAAVLRRLGRSRSQVEALRYRLRSPRERLQEVRRRAEELEGRLEAAALRAVVTRRERLGYLEPRLEGLVRSQVRQGGARVGALVGRLEALSPLGVLGRGYALATKSSGVVTDAREVEVGERLEVRLAQGRLGVEVREVWSDQPPSEP